MGDVLEFNEKESRVKVKVPNRTLKIRLPYLRATISKMKGGVLTELPVEMLQPSWSHLVL